MVAAFLANWDAGKAEDVDYSVYEADCGTGTYCDKSCRLGHHLLLATGLELWMEGLWV